MRRGLKPLFWLGSSLEDLRALPEDVKDVFGFALFLAQSGGKHVSAKPLRGFGSAGVLEVVEDHCGDTFRAVYSVKFAGAVYVLHAFQKRSKKGRATPKRDLDIVRRRLRRAMEHHAEWQSREPG